MTKRSATAKRGRAQRLRATPGVMTSISVSTWQAPSRWLSRETAVVALLGLVVAAYLAYTKLANNQLYCAGLGDCETVNASAYSQLLGVPVSLFGGASYLAVLGLSLSRAFLDDDWAFLATLGVLVLTIAGTIFSVFLTYLEFFVLSAICPWCLTSAGLTLILLVLSVASVRRQLQALGNQSGRKTTRVT